MRLVPEVIGLQGALYWRYYARVKIGNVMEH